MDSFPLLRLPLVALKTTFELFTPIDLIFLSQISKRMLELIKLGGTKNYKLGLHCEEKIIVIESIIIHVQSHLNCGIPLECHKDAPIHLHREYDSMSAYFDDPNEGVSILADYLCVVFGCKVTLLSPDSDPNVFESNINWLIKRQSEIETLYISARNLDENKLKEILNSIKVTEELCLFAYTSPEFRYTFLHEPKRIEIKHSSWFTLDKLLTSNCEIIELDLSSLGYHDLDEYLQKWESGGCPNLKELTVYSYELHVSDPMVKHAGLLELVTSNSDSVEIQRDDGVKAMIRISDHRNLLAFTLIVSN